MGKRVRTKRILLVANGEISGELLGRMISEVDFVIGVDGGVNSLYRHRMWPDMIVGDMDSIEEEVLKSCIEEEIPIYRYPSEKDETDLQLAMQEAIKMKPAEILFVGLFGDRPDHTLANIQLLQLAVRAGIRVSCHFDSGTLYAISNNLELEGARGDIVSLLPLTEKVSGITLRGFKYALEDGEMVSGVPLGISNELKETRASITIKSGILLVFHLIGGPR